MKRIAICLMVLVLTVGCGGASDVDLVKGGTMNGYETTTIGNAFDASFDNPAWEAFQGSKGERVVQFTGKISQSLHDTAIATFLNGFGLDLNSMKSDSDESYTALVQVLSFILNNLGQKTTELLWADASAEVDIKDNEFLRDHRIRIIVCTEFFNKYFWKVGEPAELQWIVTPDGQSYNLTHLASNAWAGLNTDYILQVIYN